MAHAADSGPEDKSAVVPRGSRAQAEPAKAVSYAALKAGLAELSPPLSWARAAAQKRLLHGQREEQHGSSGRALAAYLDALGMDPSFGPAYLALGQLRERLGDWQEAEECYSAGTRLGSTAPLAFAMRARLRKRLGRTLDATRDLESSLAGGTAPQDRWNELERWYAEQSHWPAALAVSRRGLYGADRQFSGQERARLRLEVLALMMLCGELDPVWAGRAPDNGWVRRSLARLAKRADSWQ